MDLRCCTAAERLRDPTLSPPEWVYADPDRRTQLNNRSIRLADCQPNLLILEPQLRRIGSLQVKLSPLFDLNEIPRQLPGCDTVRVLSLDGEVKAVVAETHWQETGPHWRVAEGVRTGFRFRVEGAWAEPTRVFPPLAHLPTEALFLHDPDPAIRVARLVPNLLEPLQHLGIPFPQAGVLLASAPLPEFPGRVFHLLESVPWKCEGLRKVLLARQLPGANAISLVPGLSSKRLQHDLQLQAHDETCVLALPVGAKPLLMLARRLRMLGH
jgi:hypothetical protein